MATRVSPSLHDEQHVRRTKNWFWSIRPLILWMRILGVDLPDASTSSSRRHRWPMYIYGLVCFSTHAFSQVNIVHSLVFKREYINCNDNPDGLPLYDTVTATWNWIIDFINYAVYGIGIHFMLLTLIRLRWNGLGNTFHPYQNVFTDENYDRLRKVSSFCVAYVILLVNKMFVVIVNNSDIFSYYVDFWINRCHFNSTNS